MQAWCAEAALFLHLVPYPPVCWLFSAGLPAAAVAAAAVVVAVTATAAGATTVAGE